MNAPAILAGNRPSAIIPTDLDSCYRLAKAVCMSGLAPRGLDTPERVMIAILHGLEIGLAPMTALQRICVVNGRPTVWGDAAIGLVRASGLCEYVKESIEDEKAICETKRRGEVEPIIRVFSIADAKRAGLWNKDGPWRQYPERMLQMRARAFCLRDVYADVLGGLYLREEIEDEPTRVVVPRLDDPEDMQAVLAYVERAEKQIAGLASPTEAKEWWDRGSRIRADLFGDETDPIYQQLRSAYAVQLRALESACTVAGVLIDDRVPF